MAQDLRKNGKVNELGKMG